MSIRLGILLLFVVRTHCDVMWNRQQLDDDDDDDVCVTISLLCCRVVMRRSYCWRWLVLLTDWQTLRVSDLLCWWVRSSVLPPGVRITARVCYGFY